MALGFSAWLWFVSLVALGISSLDFSDPSESVTPATSPTCPSASPTCPASLAVGGFGSSLSVVSGWLLVPSLFRFVCPLWVFRPCTGRIKLPSLPHYIVEPVGSHPVVISGVLPSLHSIRPACRLACILGGASDPSVLPIASPPAFANAWAVWLPPRGVVRLSLCSPHKAGVNCQYLL